jgi:hypothetical protein
LLKNIFLELHNEKVDIQKELNEKISLSEDENLALYPLYKKLNTEIEVYREKLFVRIEEFQRLVTEEKDLCEGKQNT